MKLLAFVDMHGSLKALRSIEKKAKKADLLVCAGDLTIFEQGMGYLLHELDKIGKPVLLIDGNHESVEDMRKACSLFKNTVFIHKRAYKIGNYLFLGYGGGGFSMVDKSFEKGSKLFEKEINKRRKTDKNIKIILVTHAPPYQTKIDRIMGSPCGNKSIKKFILKVKPDLAISGHLHENAGKEDKIGKTKVINPGPFGKIVNI